MSAANAACYSSAGPYYVYSTGGITHPNIIITPAFIQDFRCRTRLGRKSRKSKVKDKYKSKSRVKLNISLVKSLTAVADRPTVYVRVTPPWIGCYK